MNQLGLIAFISILLGLFSVFLLSRAGMTGFNPIFIYFLIPFFVIFISFSFLSSITPNLNEKGRVIQDYVESRSGSIVSDTGYFTIFPTIFAMFFLFLIFASYKASHRF